MHAVFLAEAQGRTNNPVRSTAAVSVVATRRLAARPAGHHAILGAGAVGACTPERRELASDVMASAALFVDSHDAALRESGDVLIAMRELRHTGLITAELSAMLGEPARSAQTARFTVFKSLGLGIEDVICAAYVLAHLTDGTTA